MLEPNDQTTVPVGPGRERRWENEPGTGPRPTPDGSTSEEGAENVDSMDVARLFAHARGMEDESVDEATALYRRILRREPDHVAARTRLGTLLERSGSPDVALEHFRAALQVEPENAAVFTGLGAALGALGRHAEAERVLRQAVSIQPEDVDARVQLARLHLRQGLYDRAEYELRAVCAQDPDNASAQLHHGETLSRLDQLDEGLAALERAVRLDPKNPRVYYLMGVLYDKKHLAREAAVMYRRARELGG